MPRVVKPAVLSGIVLVLLVAAVAPLVAGIRAAPSTVVGTPAPPMLTDFVAAAEQADSGRATGFKCIHADSTNWRSGDG